MRVTRAILENIRNRELDVGSARRVLDAYLRARVSGARGLPSDKNKAEVSTLEKRIAVCQIHLASIDMNPFPVKVDVITGYGENKKVSTKVIEDRDSMLFYLQGTLND